MRLPHRVATVLTSRSKLAAQLAGRSPQWPRVRAQHLRMQPICQACGTRDKLQVHHVKPFHVDPALELDPSNLLTLCEKPSHDCHFTWGHFHDWSRWNPNVRSMVDEYRTAAIAPIVKRGTE